MLKLVFSALRNESLDSLKSGQRQYLFEPLNIMHPSFAFPAILILFVSTALADLYASDWQGDTRRWIGPDWWASQLYDWSLQSGRATTSAGFDRSICLTSYPIVTTTKPIIFEMSVTVSFTGRPAPSTSAGFLVGRRGPNNNWLSSVVDGNKFIKTSISSTGVLKMGKKSVRTTFQSSSDSEVTLTLKASQGNKPGKATLHLMTLHGNVSAQVEKVNVLGQLALFTGGPDLSSTKIPATIQFSNFSISGPGVRDTTSSRQLGPILWVQYTLSENVLRLQAQLMPVEEEGKRVKVCLRKVVDSNIEHGTRKLVEVAKTSIHPLARTATFTIPDWDSTKTTQYVVRTKWKGKMYQRWGTVREEPQKNNLTLAVFSCDKGYAFPLQPLVEQVQKQNPDLVIFLGDQIYESYGTTVKRFGPVSDSMLDYLRKYYQFGLTWRDVLRDRPSIIIPDDHDVFQGNIWGNGGRELPLPNQSSRIAPRKPERFSNASQSQDSDQRVSTADAYDWFKERARVPYSDISYGLGGYIMPGAWVSAVEQTQVGHLPTPARPDMVLPIGIRPYFTHMMYSGVSFAILEDRKFKTGYLKFKDGDRRRMTGEGASLLGAEQETFLDEWGNNTADHVMKVALSQTLFAKGTTHGNHKLRRSSYIFDSGAWPIDARNTAVRLLSKANALTLHGDQHIGLLVELDDGAGNKIKSFMVPGTANGWPRAWWPNGGNGSVLGKFKDDAGHSIRVIAVGNPDVGSNLLTKLLGDRISPSKLAYKKGSGYGFVTLNKLKKTGKIELFRIGGKPNELFGGFPQTIEIGGES